MPSDLSLSTGPAAARAYRAGVDHLLGGDAWGAVAAFRRAVFEDPCFVLGRAGLAGVLAAVGAPAGEQEAALAALLRVSRCSRRVSLRERHQAEVVALALQGEPDRASALGREHLADFPGDDVVRWVLRRDAGGSGGAGGVGGGAADTRG